MPDLERCVSYEGKVYCWNKETNNVAVIDVKDLAFKDCPEGVLRAMLSYKKENSDER
jgi:hypothetical protein